MMSSSRLSGSDSPVSLQEPDVAEERSIQRLPEHVVNKIAAGEIIHRPANAVKEMMENSLDAGAQMIRIQLKDGGLKMLQIQDDGSGVRPSDMPLLCERFATSKLKEFSDLSRMTTFGFRGEALASISYVSASMTVLSKTRDSEVAFKACYASGHLVPPKPGQSSSPKPCAGSIGTTITAEDLFYNVPQRRRALKSAADEYNLTLEAVSKYAVHYGGRGVGFTCKKASANVVDLSVPSSPHTSTLGAISLVYGNVVAKELQQLTLQKYPEHGCSVQGWVSGANWSAKRNQFLCFINNRLVDCPALKRALLALYSTLLPRGGHPWIYLSLELAPEKVDVNVHPTKKEVHFLDEEEIVEVICNQVQELLANANTSRNFQMTQAVLTKSAQPVTLTKQSNTSTQAVLPPSSRTGYPQHMVRVDDRLRRLDAMSGFESQFQPPSTLASHSKIRGQEEGWTITTDVIPSSSTTSNQLSTMKGRIEESKTSLQSVFELREQVKKKRHLGLTAILDSYTLVGIVDTRKSLALIQHGTKLFLLQYGTLMKEAAYQAILRSFGVLIPMHLSPAPALKDLIEYALLLEHSSKHHRESITGLNDEDIIEKVCQRLLSHAEMLDEYFSIKFDPISQTLLTLPNIMPSSSTFNSTASQSSKSLTNVILFDLERLPLFLLRLITQVNWSDEKSCLDGIMQELALAHVPVSTFQIDNPIQEQSAKEKVERDWLTTWSQEFRKMIPSTSLLVREKVISEVASLPSLYSVFERC